MLPVEPCGASSPKRRLGLTPRAVYGPEEPWSRGNPSGREGARAAPMGLCLLETFTIPLVRSVVAALLHTLQPGAAGQAALYGAYRAGAGAPGRLVLLWSTPVRAPATYTASASRPVCPQLSLTVRPPSRFEKYARHSSDPPCLYRGSPEVGSGRPAMLRPAATRTARSSAQLPCPTQVPPSLSLNVPSGNIVWLHTTPVRVGTPTMAPVK